MFGEKHVLEICWNLLDCVLKLFENVWILFGLCVEHFGEKLKMLEIVIYNSYIIAT